MQKENAEQINCRLFEFEASSRPETPLLVYLTELGVGQIGADWTQVLPTRLRSTSEVSWFPPRRPEETSCTFLESCLRLDLNLPA